MGGGYMVENLSYIDYMIEYKENDDNYVLQYLIIVYTIYTNCLVHLVMSVLKVNFCAFVPQK
jgi:hypothetical protein